MKEIELKPCPFCGGEARVYYKMDIGIPSGDNGHKVSVRCENTLRCGAKIEKWAAKKAWARNSAVEAWNRREKEMSKEKKIEEMAKVMCGYYGTEKCYECRYCCDCHIKQEATRLYNAGYRKQSEGEWRIDQHGNGWCSVCNHCGFLEEEDSTDYCPNCGARMKGGE